MEGKKKQPDTCLYYFNVNCQFVFDWNADAVREASGRRWRK